MSKEDAPNFRQIAPTEHCYNCKHSYYDEMEFFACRKYSFEILSNGHINVCDSWEYDD